jgi:hypothetical protein
MLAIARQQNETAPSGGGCIGMTNSWGVACCKESGAGAAASASTGWLQKVGREQGDTQVVHTFCTQISRHRGSAAGGVRVR